MSKVKRSKKQVSPKGERLNWTPIDKVKAVSLKKMDISGRKVSFDVIRRGKKFVDRDKHLLIP